MQSTHLVKTQFFNWVSDYNLLNQLGTRGDQRLILGERYLWMPSPQGPYFGDFFLELLCPETEHRICKDYCNYLFRS